MTTEKALFKIIKSEIGGEDFLPNGEKFDYAALFLLAKRHDLVHLVSDALYKLSPEDLSEKARRVYKREHMTAVFREIRFNEATQYIRKIFVLNNVDFILLKGAVIKNLYPEPWMRTSCDVDVLIKKEDLKRAVEVLKDAGFNTDEKVHMHDVILYFNDLRIELHFSLYENLKQTDDILNRTWDYAEPVSDSEYALDHEFFVLYHLAHMTYHTLTGGCGVRPFIDLYLMTEKNFYDKEKLSPLLKESRLESFYELAIGVANAWFGGKELSESGKRLERYILSGGAYGTEENLLAVEGTKHKSRIGYLFRLAFPPLSDMKEAYPKLKKRPVLLPWYYVKRFFLKLFGKNKDKTNARIKVVTDAKFAKELSLLIADMGIDKKDIDNISSANINE